MKQPQKRKRRTKAEIEADIKAKANKVLETSKGKETLVVFGDTKEEVDEITKEVIKSKGLGDTIAKVTQATGIDKLVKFIAGEDCGCEERKEKLNQIFPYNKKPDCLTEQEYEYLTGYFEDTARNNEVKPSVQLAVIAIYNRVFNRNEIATSCPECYRNIHKEIKEVYETY